MTYRISINQGDEFLVLAEKADEQRMLQLLSTWNEVVLADRRRSFVVVPLDE